MDATSSARPLTPALTAVFSEQLGLIGRALWREGAVLAAGFALLTVATVWEIFNAGMTPDFPLDAAQVLALLGLAFAFAVWRGERLFDQGHLTTLPVERRTHILAKVLAGGVWLSGIVAWIMLWLAFMGLLAGSDMGIDRYLLTGRPGPTGEVTAEMIRQIRWTPETWNWMAAFGTAGVFYLLGTAAAVGIRYPFRWATGLLVVGLLMVVVPEELGGSDIGEDILEAVITGPVGLDYALTGGVENLDTLVVLPNKQESVAWTGLPDMQGWLRATAFWLALGLGLVWLAAWRHRER